MTELHKSQKSLLGGVVVSVLDAGPKGHGFLPGQGDGCFKGDKNSQHTFLQLVSKELGVTCKILHVTDLLKPDGDG
jgi:hypothetical protein